MFTYVIIATTGIVECLQLTLLIGGRKGIRPVKNWLVVCWHVFLSRARCTFAYGPADATATHSLLLQ